MLETSNNIFIAISPHNALHAFHFSFLDSIQFLFHHPVPCTIVCSFTPIHCVAISGMNICIFCVSYIELCVFRPKNSHVFIYLGTKTFISFNQFPKRLIFENGWKRLKIESHTAINKKASHFTSFDVFFFFLSFSSRACVCVCVFLLLFSLSYKYIDFYCWFIFMVSIRYATHVSVFEAQVP